MAWDSGTIVQATNVYIPNTTAGSLSGKLNALVGGAGVTNWSFVENIPAGTGAGQSGNAGTTCDVYKCAGSGGDANAAGVDFYVGLYGTTAGGISQASRVIVAEDYLSIAGNPANADRGKFRRWCPLPVTGTTPDVTNYTYSETYTTCAGINNAAPSNFGPSLSITGYSYWLKLTNNFLLMSVRSGTSSTSVYAGLMDSLTSVTDTMPLVTLGGSSGSFSRLPSVTAGAGGAGMWGAGMGPWTAPIQLAFAGDQSGTSDKWQGGKVHASRCLVFHGITAANGATYGWFRGLLKQDVLAIQTGGTVGLGDTIDIGGNTYTVIAAAAGLNGQSTASTPSANSASSIVVTRAT